MKRVLVTILRILIEPWSHYYINRYANIMRSSKEEQK